jgi:hypothetical protein
MAMKNVEVDYVEYEHDLFVLMTDHDAHSLGAWRLADGKWVEVDDISGPFFEGWLVQPPKDLPALPF